MLGCNQSEQYVLRTDVVIPTKFCLLRSDRHCFTRVDKKAVCKIIPRCVAASMTGTALGAASSSHQTLQEAGFGRWHDHIHASIDNLVDALMAQAESVGDLAQGPTRGVEPSNGLVIRSSPELSLVMKLI